MRMEADKYCEKILIVLTMGSENIRFNELHRQLNKYGVRMSKPTLIQHLNHLLESETIQRREGKKQNVSYGVNWRKFKQLQKAKRIDQTTLLELRNEQRFKSKSLAQQTIYTTAMLSIGELFYMKLMILNILEPSNKVQNNFSYTIIRRLYNRYASWLFDSCKESSENSKKVLHYLDTNIKALEGAFLEKNPNETEPKPENKIGILKEF